MNKGWLPLSLAVGLLACGTENLPPVMPAPDDESHDGHEKDEDDSPPLAGSLDAGRSIDAGKRDAGPKRDAGAGMVSCAPDGAVIEAPPDAPSGGDGEIGASCASDDDCTGDGLRCLTEVMLPIGSSKLTFPGGYCTRACSSDDACGPSASCPLAMAAQFAADLSNCMTRCESAEDCRDGYSCSALPAFGGQAPANPQKSCMPPSPFGAGGPRVGGVTSTAP